MRESVWIYLVHNYLHYSFLLFTTYFEVVTLQIWLFSPFPYITLQSLDSYQVIRPSVVYQSRLYCQEIANIMQQKTIGYALLARFHKLESVRIPDLHRRPWIHSINFIINSIVFAIVLLIRFRLSWNTKSKTRNNACQLHKTDRPFVFLNKWKIWCQIREYNCNFQLITIKGVKGARACVLPWRGTRGHRVNREWRVQPSTLPPPPPPNQDAGRRASLKIFFWPY